MIEGGFGYAFLCIEILEKPVRHVDDDDDDDEMIFLLFLLVVAVDCWFLMQQKRFLEEWQRSGKQKGRRTLPARWSEGYMEVICTRLKLFCLIDLQQPRIEQN